MVKVNVQPDCGNAPKKLFIRDFMIAFANSDTLSILDCVADDAEWAIVGAQTLIGKAEIESGLGKMLEGTMKELTIATIITHGDEGSSNGTITLTNGKTYGFSYVYVFTSHGKNAKFKRITSYVIQEHNKV